MRRGTEGLTRTILAVVVATLAIAAPVQAQTPAPPPANDLFVAAEVLTGSSATATSTTVGATKETGEPAPSGGSGSVWWSWTAPASGAVTVTAHESARGNVLGIYRGTRVDALSPLAQRTQEAGWAAGRLRVAVTAGETYRIAVDRWGSEGGTVKLALAFHARPANDDLAGAEVLTGTSASSSADLRGATTEPGEPTHNQWRPIQATAWWTWTAPQTGAVTISTGGSGFDTTLGVFTGSTPTGLTRVTTNDDAPIGDGTSVVAFRAIAGVSYRIAVDAPGPVPGTAKLALAWSPPPANDAFADATDLGTAATASFTGTTAGAGVQEGEPEHRSFSTTGRASVWHTWTAPTRGSVTVRADAGYQTVLAVYRGTSVVGLDRVANQPQAYNGGPEQIRVRVEAGQTYRIVVDTGSPGLAGAYTLKLTHTVSPANDDLADATVLTGTSVDVTGTNEGASQEPCEPVHEENYYDPSVWYSWTAPETAGVTLDFDGTQMAVVHAVYTGDSLCTLARVDSTRTWSTTSTKRRFRAVAGVTYRIAVDGQGAQMGSFQFTLRTRAVPVNDLFAAAIPVAGTAPRLEGDTIGATGEDADPSPGGSSAASVWYRWTAPQDGTLDLAIDGDPVPTVGVYSGLTPSTLTAVRPVAYTWRRPVTAGTTYHLAVAGTRGTHEVELEFEPAPANDRFTAAVPLTGAQATATGTNVGATREPGERRHTSWGEQSVWYSWTAPRDGRATVELRDRGSDLLPHVYTGASVDALTYVAAGYSWSTAKATFAAVAGETYRIAVDGYYENHMGAFTLSVDLTDQPMNDAFADARRLEGSADAVTQGATGATTEAEEPDHRGATRSGSVWFRWRAPADGPTTIKATGGDTVVGVYTGWSLWERQAVAPAAGAPLGEHTFSAVRGMTYRIAVARTATETAPLALTLRHATSPVNDAFAAAATLGTTAQGTLVGATRETGEPRAVDGDPGGASVWWAWTAPADGSVRFAATSAQVETILGVFTGTALDALTRVGSGREGHGSVEVAVQAGQRLLLLVDGTNDGFGTLQGPVDVTASFTAAAPPEDPPTLPEDPPTLPEDPPTLPEDPPTPPSDEEDGTGDGELPPPGQDPDGDDGSTTTTTTTTTPADPPVQVERRSEATITPPPAVAPRPAAPPATPPALTPRRAVTTPPAPPALGLSVALPAKQRAATVLTRGLTGRLSCTATCTVEATVAIGKGAPVRVLATVTGKRLTLKLPAAVRRALRGRARTTLTVAAVARSGAAVATQQRRVVVSR